MKDPAAANEVQLRKELVKTPTGLVDKQTGEIIESTPKPPQSIAAQTMENKYDRTWLNKQLKEQIEILSTTKHIVSKIQLYEMLDYTKNKFNYWMRKNGNTPSTQELQKKIDEILEARLITQGTTVKNWPFIIFLLKNNHGYQDVRDINSEHNVTFQVNRGDISPLKRKKVSSTISNQKRID